MAAQPHDHDSPEGLLSVEDARERVLGAIHPLAPLRLPLTDAYGCVVAEDVVATLRPPRVRVLRDGRVRGARLRRRRGHAVAAGGAEDRRPRADRPRARGDRRRRRGDAHRHGRADPRGRRRRRADRERDDRRRRAGPVARRACRRARTYARTGRTSTRATSSCPTGKRLGAPELGLLAIAGHPTTARASAAPGRRAVDRRRAGVCRRRRRRSGRCGTPTRR